jgi:hypothetical protein
MTEKKSFKDRLNKVNLDNTPSEVKKEIQQIPHSKGPYKRPSNERIIDSFYECKAIRTEVAKFLGVDRGTVKEWIDTDEAKGDLTLKNAWEDAKESAHDYVKGKLLSRIEGYEHKEDKIFQYRGKKVVIPTVKHYPPDVPAIQLYYTIEGLLINKTEVRDTTIDFTD